MTFCFKKYSIGIQKEGRRWFIVRHILSVYFLCIYNNVGKMSEISFYQDCEKS